MLKHGLISDTTHWSELLTFHISSVNYLNFNSLVGKSVQIKERFVTEDPYEHGMRKALNFGHTTGHSFESLALAQNHPVLHGYAVAWGLICELYLSCRAMGFPKDKMHQTMQFIKDHYGTFKFNCDQYECLYEYMKHDKKNMGDSINFTLLSDIGEIKINQKTDKKTIFEMFDFYRECMGE
jgi:3-dehydroquinate synthase